METTTQQPKRLRIGAAAARLGVSAKTLRAWAKDGKVPAVVTPSGYYLFDPTDLDRVYRPAGE
jgi:excisionase family DNA binding protein